MPVSYDTGLLLCATHLKHDQVSRDAVITYALLDTGTNSAQSWADYLQDAFADNFKTRLDTGVVIARTFVLKGAGGTVFTTGESTAAGTYGLQGQASLPANCATLVKKITGIGGRENRGRFYMPWWIAEGDVGEDNRFGGAALANRQSDCDSWLAQVTTADTIMVIANRTYDLPWTNPNRKLQSVEAGAAVTNLIVDGLIATQRRRIVR